MKVSIASITTLLAAVAAAQKPVSQDEQRGWYGCTAALLDKFEKGEDGSKSACDLWSCLHLMSTRYSRGGGLTALSSALDPVCWGTNVGSKFLPKMDFFQYQDEQQAILADNVEDGKLHVIVLADTYSMISP
ncbi:hypothetical protein CkaCkLH20_04891 [Colletotrichum karsti]|uniref:Uncharacterized protein n=1 Tax=Colletotrichum karsti TaxID=1095194 RepID=A0A9P6LM24_9PEZI|nr:uncharacterized protein CkaCkLH20_04891 [Colletotrichum karsti]KAF9877756.1 hypothetical protein CkaCkLH20_04891 [Colletotrichum karsti]